jgi:hypothetical protein
MRQVEVLLRRVAEIDSSLLITGGSGKALSIFPGHAVPGAAGLPDLPR